MQSVSGSLSAVPTAITSTVLFDEATDTVSQFRPFLLRASLKLFSASQRSDEVRLCAGKVGAISGVRKQKDTLHATDVRDCREVR